MSGFDVADDAGFLQREARGANICSGVVVGWRDDNGRACEVLRTSTFGLFFCWLGQHCHPQDELILLSVKKQQRDQLRFGLPTLSRA